MSQYLVNAVIYANKKDFKADCEACKSIWYTRTNERDNNCYQRELIAGGQTFWTVTTWKRKWSAEVSVDRSGKVKVK